MLKTFLKISCISFFLHFLFDDEYILEIVKDQKI